MKTEATKELTLADFQQQVAEKYGCERWDYLKYKALYDDYDLSISELYEEVAELYATFKFEQGKQEGEASEEIDLLALMAEYTKGWNEALHWATEQMEEYYKSGLTNTADRVRQSILNGLKEEESRSELLNCKFCKSENVYRYTCGNMVGFAKCKDCKKEFEI